MKPGIKNDWKWVQNPELSGLTGFIVVPSFFAVFPALFSIVAGIFTSPIWFLGILLFLPIIFVLLACQGAATEGMTINQKSLHNKYILLPDELKSSVPLSPDDIKGLVDNDVNIIHNKVDTLLTHHNNQQALLAAPRVRDIVSNLDTSIAAYKETNQSLKDMA